MALSDDLRNAAALHEQLHSGTLHLGAAIACLDGAVGVGSTVGHDSIPWDMGNIVGREVQAQASALRDALTERHAELEHLMDRVEDLIQALGS